MGVEELDDAADAGAEGAARRPRRPRRPGRDVAVAGGRLEVTERAGCGEELLDWGALRVVVGCTISTSTAIARPFSSWDFWMRNATLLPDVGTFLPNCASWIRILPMAASSPPSGTISP